VWQSEESNSQIDYDYSHTGQNFLHAVPLSKTMKTVR
jgi:hypothetical protein